MKPLVLTALLLAAVAASPAAHACENCNTPNAAADAVTADAMTVVRDAETGRLRAATPEEVAAMRAKNGSATSAAATTRGLSASSATTSRNTAPATAVRAYGTGAHSAKMPSALASFSVVTRTPDGALNSRCVQGEETATEMLRTHAAANAAARAAVNAPTVAPTTKRETE